MKKLTIGTLCLLIEILAVAAALWMSTIFQEPVMHGLFIAMTIAAFTIALIFLHDGYRFPILNLDITDKEEIKDFFKPVARRDNLFVVKIYQGD